jgi:hypothetical protein
MQTASISFMARSLRKSLRTGGSTPRLALTMPGGAGEVFVVEIAEGGDVDVGVFEEAVEAAGAHVADADEADVDAVVGGGEGGTLAARKVRRVTCYLIELLVAIG